MKTDWEAVFTEESRERMTQRRLLFAQVTLMTIDRPRI